MDTIPFFTPDLDFYGAAVADCIRSGWVGPGDMVHRFENAVAELVGAGTGVKHYAIATTSGTAALDLAATALVEGHAREGVFLCPAYGISATSNAITSRGRRVEFVDVDNTGTMCLEALGRRLGAQGLRPVAAVVWVHFSGVVEPTFAKAVELCRLLGVPLLEDAACALGAQLAMLSEPPLSAGTAGLMSCFSFSVHKPVTTGQGGMVVTRDVHLAELCRCLINHGDASGQGYSATIGWNGRLSDIQATLGVHQVERLPAILERRMAQYTYFRLAMFKAGLESLLFKQRGNAAPLHNIVRVRDRPRVHAALRGAGVDARMQYHRMPELPVYGVNARAVVPFPTEKAWFLQRELLYLPFGRRLSEEQMDHMVAALVAAKAAPPMGV